LYIEILKKEMGFLKEKKAGIKEEGIQAISYDTGIFIKINDIEVWSEGFKKTSYLLLFLFVSLSVLAVIISLILFGGLPIMFSMIVSVIILAILLPWTLFREKETAEWHAAEHKLIYLLTAGSELNLQNLQNAPMFMEGCGNHNGALKDPPPEKLIETLKLGKEVLRRLKT
jgi:hypothetical protein